MYIDIIQDHFYELKQTVFHQASKCAREKINELFKTHSQFTKEIAPMALLLNPSVPFDKLLKPNEILTAKSLIIERMEAYEVNNNKATRKIQANLKKYFSGQNNLKKAPLEKILDERNLEMSSDALKNFWFSKIETDEKALALVAVDILGMVITSVASERSFSRGRLVINEQRTRITSDHANQQMIVQLNPKEAQTAMTRTNIFH